MDDKYKIAGFQLPHTDNKINRILSSALEGRIGKQGDIKISNQVDLIYWDANFFGLDRVNFFQAASEEEQIGILQQCCEGIIKEAYFIEKAGVGYMAKMISLAETTEERMLYGCFCGDEAAHLSQICQFLPESFLNNELAEIGNQFLKLLAEVAESCDKTVLLFILQVVLEGWGLTHYRSLAKSCQNPNLCAVFQGFLNDESRHHATGITLLNRTQINSQSRIIIVEILVQFLQMVQVGPQSVLAAISNIKGGLSRQQSILVLEELDTQTHSGTRLEMLRSLMQTEQSIGVIDE
ncbi:ferritin-like domain-containing protein, partial [Brunnivagina elsteri]